MHRPLQILALLLVLALPASAQTFATGDYQINRKKATAGFEVAELLAGSNITITWNDAAKTATLTSPLASTGGTSITTLGTITTGTWQATAIADTYIASAATWNAKQTALVSGTNLKTVNGTSLLGSGNLAVGNVTDGDTLTTGLTFPFGTFRMRNEEDSFNTVLELSSYTATANRILFISLFGDSNRSISLSGDLTVASTATISNTNTGDQTTITGNSGTTTAALGLKTATSTVGISTATAPSSGQVLTATSSTAANWQTPAATGVTSVTGTGTVNGLTLSGTVTSTGNLTLGGTLTGLDAGSITTGTLPVANGGVHPLVTTGNNGSGYGRIGLWDADNTDWIYFSAGPSKFIFPDIQAASFSGDGSSLTSLNASNISTGTLGVPRGGTGATTLTANNVLLGNGTGTFQTVAPGTTGNVLTSNGTTWTSTAPATTNPAGSGSELQFRSTGTAFGSVTNSSVSGATLTLGNAEALATTPTAYLTLRNMTAAGAGAQQVSPSLVLEGRGWKTDATAASQTVRFRENVLPVQGTANPTATWQLQSEINNLGTFANRVTVSSLGVLSVSGDSNTITIDAKDSNNNISATRHINITPGNGWTLFLNASVQVLSTNTFGFSSDVVLGRDAANTLAQRNGTNAQIFRLYETDSGANDEYLEFSAASGINLIRPQATGTGTASVVRYHTTTTVFWTSGSGSPESVVTAPVGCMYTDTAGGAATTLYVKESGSGSTGWIAK